MTRPVIVTTEYRGVFFGYSDDTSGDTVKLKKMRNCLYWDSSIGGFLGLAKTGQNNKCRIGAESDAELRKVTSVLEVTPEAESAWNNAKTYKG